VPVVAMDHRITLYLRNIKFLHYHSIKIARKIFYQWSAKKYNTLIHRSLAMGTLKTYSLFTISQESKVDEIHDSGKHNEVDWFDFARDYHWSRVQVHKFWSRWTLDVTLIELEIK
jgi:hypothetical protein